MDLWINLEDEFSFRAHTYRPIIHQLSYPDDIHSCYEPVSGERKSGIPAEVLIPSIGQSLQQIADIYKYKTCQLQPKKRRGAKLLSCKRKIASI